MSASTMIRKIPPCIVAYIAIFACGVLQVNEASGALPDNVEVVDVMSQAGIHTVGSPKIDGLSMDERIAQSSKEIIVVLADRLSLKDLSLSLADGTRPSKEIVILATAIEVDGEVLINLESASPIAGFLREARPVGDAVTAAFYDDAASNPPKLRQQFNGRNISFLANEIRFNPGSRIIVKQRDYLRVVKDQLAALKDDEILRRELGPLLDGLNTSEIRQGEAGQGGRMRLAANRLIYPGSQNDVVRDREAVFANFLMVSQAGHTQSGDRDARGFLSGLADWVPQEVTAVWLARRLELLDGKFTQADLRSDLNGVNGVFSEINELPQISILDGIVRDRGIAILEKIKMARERFQQVRSELLSVTCSGRSQAVTIFLDGVSGNASLLPTEILLRRHNQSDKEYFGTVRLPSTDKVEFAFQAKLTASPDIEVATRRKLAERGLSLSGVFTSLSLQIDKNRLPQFVEDARIANQGEFATITLLVKRELANQALLGLSSVPGLPIPVQFKSGTVPPLEGSMPLSISLSKRTDVPILVTENRVYNRGYRTVYLRSVRLDANRIKTLDPPLTIEPNAYATLDIARTEIDKDIAIQDEAIETAAAQAFSLEDLFPIDKEDVVEELSVVNRLVSNNDRGGKLKRVEINVDYIVTNGAATDTLNAGTFELSEFNTSSYSKEILVLKPRQGQSKLRVKGTVFYDNGIAKFDTTIDGTRFEITEELLPLLQQ